MEEGKSNQHFIEGKESMPSFYIRKRREIYPTLRWKRKKYEIRKERKRMKLRSSWKRKRQKTLIMIYYKKSDKKEEGHKGVKQK